MQTVNIAVKSSKYDLQLLGYWGGPWARVPTDVNTSTTESFRLEDNDKAGIWYRAIDPKTKDEIGLVCMSFTCPKHSHNSAEGSPTQDQFLSAGLQTYQRKNVDNLYIRYNVGEPNLAWWDDGDHYDPKIECNQTKMDDTRAWITIRNPNAYYLLLEDYWNSGGKEAKKWFWEPTIRDVPPPNGKRTIALLDNNKAGIFLKVFEKDNITQKGFSNLVFTCPEHSNNSAEGSPSNKPYLVPAGLQGYERKETPVYFKYEIGNENKACWDKGNIDNKNVECEQTNFKNASAFITVGNETGTPLSLTSYWNDSKEGAADWYAPPCTGDNIPVDGRRIFVLKDNNKAGICFNVGQISFHITFARPKYGEIRAEGSFYAGLQKYKTEGTPAEFTYNIGTPNLAYWYHADKNDGTIVCSETWTTNAMDTWMKDLKAVKPGFGDLTLATMMMPGSHDSACYDMDSTVASSYTQTQPSKSTFAEQLKMGVRYFDLRLTYVDNKHIFHHGKWATKQSINDLISQVSEFYSIDWYLHQNEIVVLDFTHFGDYDSKKYQELFTLIANSTLNQFLVQRGSPNPSLNSIWGLPKGRVIASVNFDASTYQDADNIWNGKNIFPTGWDENAFWPEASETADLIIFLNKIIAAAPYGNNMWVLQDILTPSVIISNPIKDLARLANAMMFGDFGASWRTKSNIIIQDYVDNRLAVQAYFSNKTRSK